MDKTKITPIHEAVLQALDECLDNDGMRTVVQVKGQLIQVKGYGVGQNVLRLDVVFAPVRTRRFDYQDAG